MLFQSTLPRGSDDKILAALFLCCVFQSTLPRGSDQRRGNCRVAPRNFNPRSLAGATCSRIFSATSGQISIHAPSRERLIRSPNAAGCQQFQSTLPHGSDWRRCNEMLSRNNFNPRSLTGATNLMAIGLHIMQISIHAPLRERPEMKGWSIWMAEFQSTLPYGSD